MRVDMDTTRWPEVQPIFTGYRADGTECPSLMSVPQSLAEMEQLALKYLRLNPDAVRLVIDLALA